MIRRLVMLMLVLATSGVARGDGGVVIAKASEKSLDVTIFAPADVAAGQMADVSAMVQRDGQVALDAIVELTFSPSDGVSISVDDLKGQHCCAVSGDANAGLLPTTFRATREQATNQLLYATAVRFPSAGTWRVRAKVLAGDAEAIVASDLHVRSADGRIAMLWPYLAIAPLGVGLFAMNRWLSRGRRGVA